MILLHNHHEVQTELGRENIVIVVINRDYFGKISRKAFIFQQENKGEHHAG